MNRLYEKTALMILVVLMTAAPAVAVEIGGVTFPDTVTVDGEQLILNGAGSRKKFFIDIYVAGLYLKEKSAAAGKIINADEPMMLRLEVVNNRLTSEDFTAASRAGFEEATGGNTEPIQAEIDQFLRAFAGKINKGDVFDILYLPDQGVRVFKNEKPDTAAVVKGLPVKKALFGIWLGHRTERRLRNLTGDLLGK